MRCAPIVKLLTLLGLVLVSTSASAWFFIIPIPNVAKPGQLNTLIDALEKSEETKALAYVSEDKLFGAKYWVWGHHAGHVTQSEADRIALGKCRASLAKAKAEQAGGKDLYDYGKKDCELYEFSNKTVSMRAPEQIRAVTASPTPPTSVALLAAAAAPLSVNTSAGLRLPGDWETTLATSRDQADGVILSAINRSTDSRLMLFTYKREGIADMMAFAASKRAWQASQFTDTQQSEIAPMLVNGAPAWRYMVSGLSYSNARYTYLHTVVDAGREIVLLSTWTTASTFEAQRPALEKLAEGLTGITTGSPTATTALPTTPSSGETLSAPKVERLPLELNTPPTSVTPPVANAAQRLRTLDGIYKEGLISKKEYEEKKKKILESL